MLLAVFAMGYNIAFGYTGLLSLGHALFFAAGLYAAGLPALHCGWGALAGAGSWASLAGGGDGAALVGLLALRTQRRRFMIVTLMFAQAGYLTILYFTAVTRGEEGFVIPGPPARPRGARPLATRRPAIWRRWRCSRWRCSAYLALVRSRLRPGDGGDARERGAQPDAGLRSPSAVKLAALSALGAVCGAAGAVWGLMFGYVGAGFAAIQYSILPLLYVLLGGAGTVLGPLLGAALMFYLIDLTSGLTNGYLFVVGVALVGAGAVRAARASWARCADRWPGWLP